MDLSKEISKLKSLPGFKSKVGMILIHNGVVRGVSRKGKKVNKLKVQVNFSLIEEIRSYFEKKDGIYKIVVEAKEGEFVPGDDLLWIVVAGDIRENVKSVLSSLLDEIKSKAIKKEEILEEDKDI